MPVETIFSGPAASIMGVMALMPTTQTSVVVDIGGTTTDLALILSGKPLLSSKGARVNSLLTHVRAFAVKSVAIGGDSAVSVADGCIAVGPHREGPALCMGGPCATTTDALRVLGLSDIGDVAAADKAMADIAKRLGCTPKEVAQRIIDAVVDKIVSQVNEMFREWEQEPAYRVWEIMKKELLQAQNVVGVGGAAQPLVPLVAQRLGAKAVIPEYAPVANAIGAAVARPTLTLNLRIDTERGEYIVAEEGLTGKSEWQEHEPGASRADGQKADDRKGEQNGNRRVCERGRGNIQRDLQHGQRLVNRRQAPGCQDGDSGGNYPSLGEVLKWQLETQRTRQARQA